MALKGMYQALNKEKREIRLLDLLPASTHSAPLRGAIRHGPVDREKYCALSYVLGDQTVDRGSLEIICITTQIGTKFFLPAKSEKRVISIGSSLEQALRSLRLSDTALTFWVDAVCINQSDDCGKSWQVALMGDIYRNATTVHTWPGPMPETNLFFVFVRKVEEYATRLGLDQTRSGDWLAMNAGTLFENDLVEDESKIAQFGKHF